MPLSALASTALRARFPFFLSPLPPSHPLRFFASPSLLPIPSPSSHPLPFFSSPLILPIPSPPLLPTPSYSSHLPFFQSPPLLPIPSPSSHPIPPVIPFPSPSSHPFPSFSSPPLLPFLSPSPHPLPSSPSSPFLPPSPLRPIPFPDSNLPVYTIRTPDHPFLSFPIVLHLLACRLSSTPSRTRHCTYFISLSPLPNACWHAVFSALSCTPLSPLRLLMFALRSPVPPLAPHQSLPPVRSPIPPRVTAANVRTYSQQYEEEQTQSLIDQRIWDHLGSIPIGSRLPIGSGLPIGSRLHIGSSSPLFSISPPLFPPKFSSPSTQYEEEQTQSLIDQRIRDHLGSVPIGSGLPIGAAAAAAAAGGGAAPGGFPQQLLRPGMPPMGLPGMPGMPGMPFGMPGGAGRGAVLPLPGQFFGASGMRPPMGGMVLMRPSR
ncbi:unnamed protein product [Closterium sp. NIES-65]|nr:unnamed protein product [Closterium sp. NIES-65]